MQAKAFVTEVADFFQAYYGHLNEGIRHGSLTLHGSCAFPAMLRVGESPIHFIVELCGFKDPHRPYSLRRPNTTEKALSTSAYLNPGFDVDETSKPSLDLGMKHWRFEGLTFCTKHDHEVYQRKINLPSQCTQLTLQDADVPIIVRPEADFVLLRNVDLIRTDSFRLAFRTFATALIVQKNVTRSTLLEWLNSLVQQCADERRVFGIGPPPDAPTEELVRQLLSFADQDVDEPIIDRFLQCHERHFSNALGYRAALSQLKLRWIERQVGDPQVSEPDYLMLRGDGYYDILDLKRAALKYRSITKGRRARLRFIDYVNELIAQLSGYLRYFASKTHRKWAFTEYGIEVSEPKLIGIVGNYDSVQPEDVDIALEPYKGSIAILSYADVINLLRKRELP